MQFFFPYCLMSSVWASVRQATGVDLPAMVGWPAPNAYGRIVSKGQTIWSDGPLSWKKVLTKYFKCLLSNQCSFPWLMVKKPYWPCPTGFLGCFFVFCSSKKSSYQTHGSLTDDQQLFLFGALGACSAASRASIMLQSCAVSEVFWPSPCRCKRAWGYQI